jgi:hypothetical protein
MCDMLLMLLPLSLLAGLLTTGPALGEAFSILYVGAALAIIFRWVQSDSVKRKTRVSLLLRIALVVLTVFALPYYFFRSRGWLGGLKLTAQAWLVFTASMLCYRIGYAL